MAEPVSDSFSDLNGIGSLFSGGPKDKIKPTVTQPVPATTSATYDLTVPDPKDPLSIIFRTSISDELVEVGAWDLQTIYDVGAKRLTPFTGQTRHEFNTQTHGCHESMKDNDLDVTFDIEGAWGELEHNVTIAGVTTLIKIPQEDVKLGLLRVLVATLQHTALAQDHTYPVYSECGGTDGAFGNSPARNVEFKCSESYASCDLENLGCGWQGKEDCPFSGCSFRSPGGPCFQKRVGSVLPQKTLAHIYFGPKLQTGYLSVTFQAKRLKHLEPCSIWLKMLYGALLVVTGMGASMLKSVLFISCAWNDEFDKNQPSSDMMW